MREIHADVVIVGAGPAGIAAAVRAAELGRTTVLVDEAPRAGGQIWRHRRTQTLPRNARAWLTRLEGSEVQRLQSASVFDASAAPLFVDAEQTGTHVRVHAAHGLVLATGARERFLPFPGWTLPAVIGVGAAQALMKAGLSVAGKRIVIAGTGPLLLPVAALAARAGAHVLLVAEQAPAAQVRRFAQGLWRSPARLLAAAKYRAAFARTPYLTGRWVVAAHGDESVRAAVVTDGTRMRTVPCDLLCVAYGLTPATELPRLLGCAVHDGAVVVDDRQQTTVDRVFSAGETTGVAGADAALLTGQIAGLAAAAAMAGEQDAARNAHGQSGTARTAHGQRNSSRVAEASLVSQLRTQRAFARRMDEAFSLRSELLHLAQPDTIVCRCEDVAYEALASFTVLRDAKLLTRAGMGACQGRVCGTALRQLFNWEHDTVRPPLTPALIGTLADYAQESVHAQK